MLIKASHDVNRNIARSVARISSRGRFILTGVLLIIAIIAATVALVFMQRNDAIAAYQTATSNLGNGMAQQTTQAITSADQVLHDIETSLASATGAPADQVGMAMRTEASLALLVSASKSAKFATGLAMVDASGVIRNSSGLWTFSGRNVSGQDFFSHFGPADDHDSFVSAPLKRDGSGRWVSFLSRRISDAQGGFAGIAVAEISLTAIEEFYSGAMPARRSVSLVRSDGTVLVRFPHREDEIGKKIPEHTAWYAVVEHGGGAYHANDYFTDTPVVAFARPLKNLPLVVEASVTEADVLSDWPRQILSVVLGASIATIGVVMLLQHLAGQVDRLERSRSALASKNCELETAHNQLDAALANISLGVCFFSGDEKLILSNQGYRDIYHLAPEATRPGISLSELMNNVVKSARFPHVGIDAYLSVKSRIVEAGERQQEVVELATGQSVLVTHQPMQNGGWVETHEDITERLESDRNIRYLAHHDALTGLVNRAFFAERLEGAMARLRRHGKPFAVFMIDLDRFKNVNDTLGHPAGDQVLREAAQRLRALLRETDQLARLGGDEFAIIQSDEENTRGGAAGLAARISKIIAAPYDINGNRVCIGTSIGIALAPEDADDSTDLLKRADVALYEAKNAGRNGFRFFDASMVAAADDRRGKERQIRVAESSAA